MKNVEAGGVNAWGREREGARVDEDSVTESEEMVCAVCEGAVWEGTRVDEDSVTGSGGIVCAVCEG